jgi:hypothetical protein
MNRAERRKLPAAIRAFADNLHLYRCPDCDSDTRLVQDECGVWLVQVNYSTP